MRCRRWIFKQSKGRSVGVHIPAVSHRKTNQVKSKESEILLTVWGADVTLILVLKKAQICPGKTVKNAPAPDIVKHHVFI